MPGIERGRRIPSRKKGAKAVRNCLDEGRWRKRGCNKMPVKSVNEFVIGLRLPINDANKNRVIDKHRLGDRR